jgi:hypothetical protein
VLAVVDHQQCLAVRQVAADGLGQGPASSWLLDAERDRDPIEDKFTAREGGEVDEPDTVGTVRRAS